MGTALVVYVGVSLMTEPTDPAVLAPWQRRLRGQAVPENGAQAEAPHPARAEAERTD